MPLFLRWQYLVALLLTFLLALVARRAGLRYGLTLLALVSIILCLWLFGFHPLGFLVSPGGWLVFLLTVLLSMGLSLLADAIVSSRSASQYDR